jgi:hypothetical protein
MTVCLMVKNLIINKVALPFITTLRQKSFSNQVCGASVKPLGNSTSTQLSNWSAILVALAANNCSLYKLSHPAIATSAVKYWS